MQRCCTILTLLLVLACLPAVSRASIVFMANMDDVDGSSSPADSYSFEEVLGSSPVAEDADIDVQTTLIQDETNGGDSTSQWAAHVNVDSAGEQAYYETCDDTTTPYCDMTPFPLTNTQVSMHVAIHLPSAPSGSRKILAFVEESTSEGCQVTLTSSGTLTLSYAGTSLGTSSQVLRQFACVPDSATEPPLPCTAATESDDCPSGTCSATVIYWAGVTLTQESAPPFVTCTLRIDGRVAVTDGPTDRSAQRVDLARVGALGTEAVALEYYFDSVVIASDSLNVGYGYVTLQSVAADGGSNNFSKSSSPTCAITGSGNHYSCIDDYTRTNAFSSNNLRRVVQNGVESYDTITPEIDTLPIGATIPAVEAMIVARAASASGGTNRTLQLSLDYCAPGAACTTGTTTDETVIVAATSYRASLRSVETTPPGVGGALGWTHDEVNAAGLTFATGPNCCAGFTTHVGAAMLSAFVQRADAVLPRTLIDHNVGTEDTLVTVVGIGDSTAGGTSTVECIGGERDGLECTQADYCDWDTDLDKPANGCQGVNAKCTTCDGRRPEVNGGAGYFCDLSAGTAGTCDHADDICCGDVSNTCSGDGDGDGIKEGTCAKNDAVPCDVDDDCTETAANGGLGDCDETAQCVASCPCPACSVPADCPSDQTCSSGFCTCGAECPVGRTGWVDFLSDRFNADVVFRCFQGGETITQMVDNRFSAILNGPSASRTDCSLQLGARRCTCDTAADCGTGGTCTAGICVSSDTDEDECTVDGDCAGGHTCIYPKPDYLVVLEGFNDGLGPAGTALMNAHNPNCDRGFMHALHGDIIGSDTLPCNVPSALQTLCSRDADCASIHADSRCLGFFTTNTARFCSRVTFGNTCTVTNTLCRDDTDCGLGTACDIDDPTACDFYGVCECSTADTECAGTSKCARNSGGTIVGPTCHKACTSDSDCGSVSGACNTTYGYCKGYCTVPSGGHTCTTDAECERTTAAHRDGYTITYHGTCVTGACTCTGPSSWENTTECTTQFADFYGGQDHTLGLLALQSAQATIDAADATTPPLLIVSTLPRKDTSLSTCGVHHAYLSRFSVHVPDLFTYSFNPRPVLAEYAQDATRTDVVHFSALGASLVGYAGGDYMAAWNACANDGGTPEQLPQKYCQNPNRTYETTTCDADTDCASTERCVPKACTSDSDCPGAATCNPE